MLRYGVLGLLIERRGYGYQLVQRLSERLGAAWHLTPSAVYGALDQLDRAGLIKACPGVKSESAEDRDHHDRSSRRTARVVYEATPRGITEYRSWLTKPTVRSVPIRSELQLRLALACPEDIPCLLASIVQEEHAIMQRLDEECQAAGRARRFAQPIPIDRKSRRKADAEPRDRGVSEGPSAPGNLNDSSSWPAAAATLVNAAATIRLQAELEWIELVRETLQRMSVQHHTAVGLISTSGAPAIQ